MIQALAQFARLLLQDELAPDHMRWRLLLFVHHSGYRVSKRRQVTSAVGYLHLALPLRRILIRVLSERLLLSVVVVRILQDGREPLLDVAKRARRRALVKIHFHLDIWMNLRYRFISCLSDSKMSLFVHHLNFPLEPVVKFDKFPGTGRSRGPFELMKGED